MAGDREGLPARNFDGPSVASQLAATRGDHAVEARGIVGPNDHLAAVAVIAGIGRDDCTPGNFGKRGVANRRVCPLVVAPNQHVAAAGVAGSVDPGVVGQDHVVSKQVDRPTGVPRAEAADVDGFGNGERAMVARVEMDGSSLVGN